MLNLLSLSLRFCYKIEFFFLVLYNKYIRWTWCGCIRVSFWYRVSPLSHAHSFLLVIESYSPSSFTYPCLLDVGTHIKNTDPVQKLWGNIITMITMMVIAMDHRKRARQGKRFLISVILKPRYGEWYFKKGESRYTPYYCSPASSLSL